MENKMTYDTFISQFEIYPTKRSAQKKGFEAHHIIPRAMQDTPDDRCVRLTPFQHIYAHYLLALEDERAKIIFALMVQYNFKKLSDLEKITLEQLEEWARLREEGRTHPDYLKRCSERSKRMWADEDFYKQQTQKIRDWYASTENRKVFSDRIKRMYEEHPELKQIQSDNFKKMWADTDFKARMKEKAKETWSREDLRQRVGESTSRYYADESNRQKQSEISRNYWESEEARKNQADIMKATKWWNNGHVNTRSKDCPGQGFVLGRLNQEYPQETRQAVSKRMKGLVYWNNGTVNRRSKECPGQGWVQGKIHSDREREKNCRKVIQLSKDGQFIAEYESIHEAERQTGVSFKHISQCCLHMYGRKSAGGYIWRYKEVA